MKNRKFKFILFIFLLTAAAFAGSRNAADREGVPEYFPVSGSDTLINSSLTDVTSSSAARGAASTSDLYPFIRRLPVYFDTLKNSNEILTVRNIGVNWGYSSSSASQRNIDAIIVHSSYNTLDPDSFSVFGVIEQYRRYKVSSHYLIDKDGGIIRLVDEKYNAWHAGKSTLPDGRENVNGCSIGIEIINTVKSPPSKMQYDALARLIRNIRSRYKIKYVLGHSEIAPVRKTDPWNFDWKLIRPGTEQAAESVSRP